MKDEKSASAKIAQQPEELIEVLQQIVKQLKSIEKALSEVVILGGVGVAAVIIVMGVWLLTRFH